MIAHPPTFPDSFNMADYFVFSNIEAGRGEKVAIHFEGRAITYRQVADNVMRVARNLVGDGLLPEQRVLVCMQDRPEFAYAWFGALKAGAVVTQINPLLPAADYEYYLNYVKPQFAIVDEQSLPEFDKALANTRHCGGGENVIVVGTEARGRKNFDTWLDAKPKPGAEPWPTRKDDPAVWLFTSGTTGQSKGAVHCHFHFPFNTEVYAKHFIGMRESDVTISGPRLFFGYATGTNLMFPFAVGATTVLFREQPSARIAVRTDRETQSDGVHERADADQQDAASARRRAPRHREPPLHVERRRGACRANCTSAGTAPSAFRSSTASAAPRVSISISAIARATSGPAVWENSCPAMRRSWSTTTTTPSRKAMSARCGSRAIARRPTITALTRNRNSICAAAGSSAATSSAKTATAIGTTKAAATI